MVFREYIEKLPDLRQEAIREIAELTCSTTASVYRWMNGAVTPPLVKQKIIAEYLKVETKELFPEDEKEVVNGAKQH